MIASANLIIKKLFKRLFFILFATATVFSFSACDDDDDDDATNLSQAQIEEYIYGVWNLDLGDTYYRFWLAEDNGDDYNGNFHYYDKTDSDRVLLVTDFHWELDGNTIIITLPNYMQQEGDITYKIVEINASKMKFKGALPHNQKEGTYTLTKEGNLR